MSSIKAFSISDAPAAGYEKAPNWVPFLIYVLIASSSLGLAAYTASTNMISDQPNKDIWQHIAAVRALMENLTAPANPFVLSAESSRHFHPLWVATAAIGNALGLTPWQAITGATYAIMATFAFAVHFFARTYFRSPWAPSVLLFVMLFAWSLTYGHTGLHSIWTLFYGAAYPATFLIALSLLQWAFVIRALDGQRYLPALAALSALMLATHQLGAVIGCIGAASFVAAQPGAAVMRRVVVMAAILIGLAAALAWPYFNPLELMLQTGNSTWDGGPNFYAPPWMPFILMPAALGLLWMRHREARPLALALAIYFGIYLLGLLDIKIGLRFMMPVVLVLHIGLAGVILEAMERFSLPTPFLRQSAPWIATAAAVTLAVAGARAYQKYHDDLHERAPYLFAAAVELTADIPDDEPVAVEGLAAWPVVATGQRVLSVPWPEPGISDLSERQQLTKSLFVTDLSPEERRALAESLGIRVLIVDERLVLPATLEALTNASTSTQQRSTMRRFDLWD